ncbi:MAG: hypothetical protein EAZ07_09745 [Cytophagales bacterium]|nr:MAG: hypothetical protein EAZ07_09745 [Cytophagales bacterium]
MKCTFLWSLILGLSSITGLYAQKNELGGGLGTLNYIGEVSGFYNPLNIRPAGYVFYRRNFSPVVASRFALTVGNIQATEIGSTPAGDIRKASFNGLLTDISITFEYNFFDYILNYLDRKYARKYCPYLTGGIALYNFNSSSSEIKKTNTNTQIAFPLGVGIKYMVTDKINIGAELVARKTLSDKLDGVDNNLINNKLASDPEDKDYYYFFGINISYTFYKVHCPKN